VLEHITVKNAALIENADIRFADGLNILSGETGSGKSMLIDAVNFVLGHRPKSAFVRGGAEKAEVEALFSIKRLETQKALGDAGVALGAGGALLIFREAFPDGKTRCKINGRTVTLAFLREITDALADVHGQHEHQSLLNAARHISLLDSLCGERIALEKAALADVIAAYKQNDKTLKELYGGSEKERRAIIELLERQRNEIEAVNPRSGEEESLLKRRRELMDMVKKADAAFGALALLAESPDGQSPDGQSSGGQNRASIGQMPAGEQIAAAANFLKDFGTLGDALLNISAQIDDVTRELRDFTENIDNSPRELYDIETRLDAFYALKQKYGGSMAAVLSKLSEIRQRIDTMDGSASAVARLTREKKRLAAEIIDRCAKISDIRANMAKNAADAVVSTLRELGMKQARFEILLERKKTFSANGFDSVEFLIAPNVGEPLMSLAKIASGGEISRVMLALKAVLSDADNIETFIFDEIDTGVSGRTAQRVAEKLSAIAKNHQILCITHLPQIAAAGERHFLIEKRTDDARTTTSVAELDDDGVTAELARLISGARVTDASIKAAAEMKRLAVTSGDEQSV
jgi:DNA repair protein RecN (Recombination protein N)